jgi:ParB family chromosome partitioning protein
VRETENLIQRLKKKPAKRSAAKKDPVLRDLEKELSSLFMTAIQIRQQKNKGSIEIKFKTAEELHRLVALLMNLTENK